MLLATILVLFTVIISLQSRTGLVGFAAVIALLLIRSRPLPELGVLTAVVTLLLAYVGLAGGMEEIRSWSFIARGDAYRWELWTKVLHEAWDCGVITGCGYGHNPVAGLKYSPGVPIAHAHNIFIAQILFGGIIGLSLMLAMFGCSLLRGWRHARPWALFLFSALIMLNFDGSSLIDNPDELWPLVHWPLAVLLVLNAQFATHSRHQPPLGAPAT
jgi:O-antigen ligase